MKEIPKIGFGTGGLKNDTCYEAVSIAIEVGYRLFDTASFYENEEEVARAINDSRVKREDVYIVSKLWNNITTYEDTIIEFEKTLKRLNTSYIDMYLIHWPKSHNRNIEVWKALEYLKEIGKILDIGVSNFSIEQLDVLTKNSKVKPVFNQIEYHPHFQQKELVEYCKRNGIKVMSYGQFGKGNFTENEELLKIANNHKKTVHQVILNWLNRNGIYLIPKSININRITENFEAFNFYLNMDEMDKIDEMDLRRRYYSIFT